MHRKSRDGMPNCKMFTYKATSLPNFNLVSGFLNDIMHFSCYIYVPTSSSSMLCDVSSRSLIADIIYHNSVFSSLNFNNSWVLRCKEYRLAFISPLSWNNTVPGSPMFASCLMICSTKYRYTTTDGKRRLVQIQTRVSNQQLTILG